MDILSFLSHFLYRIRYTLFFGIALAALLAIYFTGFLPKTYVVTTTVFTGITSKTALDDPTSGSDWNSATNAHDNIINLIKSKSTMQKISMGLLAEHLIYGDPDKDNNYITAKHYNQLLKMVPPDVLALVDKSSVEKTIENFETYRTEDKNNFIYAVFSWSHEHYSYLALQKIKVRRKEASDMIEISYESNDPGIATNTVALLNKELANRYEDLLLSTSNSVVKHFEEQLILAEQKLSQMEDSLVRFNSSNKIINYEEQTKHLAALNNIHESRYEEILLSNQSSKALLSELESQMDTRVKLIGENEEFLRTLEDISTLNGKIAEIEIFGGGTSNNTILQNYKTELAIAHQRIKDISNRIDTYKHSKEGVAITSLVNNWLAELMKYQQTTSELKVMENQRKDLDSKYEFFSPVGPNLNRMDRSVHIAEESYLTILHHLGLAILKQKNILLSSGTLQVVTPPEFPLLSIPRNRPLYVLATVMAAFVFIVGFFLLLEILDRTVRNKHRAERLTKGKVIGTFPQNQNMRFRGYTNEIRHIAITHLANTLNQYIEPGKTMIINLLSIEPEEGKSLIAEQLQTYWKEMGFSVKHLNYHDDFVSDAKQFLQASDPFELLPTGEIPPEILIVEYASLKTASVPKPLLEKASISLLIVNAERTWKVCDQPFFDDLQLLMGNRPLFIYLNKTDREATEEILGQLPPHSRIRNWIYKLLNFGITAKSN